MEVSQSHPVMKAFCGLLLDMMVEGGPAGRKIRDAEEGRDPESQTYPHHITAHLQDGWTLSLLSRSASTACSSTLSGIQENTARKATSHRRIRSRWQLLYTLVNNPSLLGSRKHFQTLQTSESFVNGTPSHGSKKGGKKEASQPAAEAVQSAEAPTNQEIKD